MVTRPQQPALVTGATGTVGRSVVNALLEAGLPVRAAARDVDAVRRVWENKVEACRFDFTEPATWPAAYSGVRQMFVLRPPHLSRPKRQMIPALEAARSAGVEQMVLLSLQGAEHNRVVPHAKLESWIRQSGLDWTFVRPSFFMQNLATTHAGDIRGRGEIVLPAGQGRTAFVDALDVGRVAAAALVRPDEHRKRCWTPTGPAALTYHEVAGTLTEILGRPIHYRPSGLLRYAKHARRELLMPWTMVAVTAAIYTVARIGRADTTTEDVRRVTGVPPVTFVEFSRRVAATWRS